jgi:hypothetical protein
MLLYRKVAKKLSDALVEGGILLVIDYVPEYMETRCYTDYDQNS